MTLMRRHPVWAAILCVHVGIVLLLTVIVLVLLLPTLGEADANIGAGLAGLPLLALGVPWSLPLLVNVSEVNSFEYLPRGLRYLIAFGSAWLNVVLHAVVFVVVGRRGVARSQAAQASSA